LLILLFLLKNCIGYCLWKILCAASIFSGSDTWRYFNESLKETDWLLRQPAAFVKDIFSSGYNAQSNLFTGKNSYWNDLKSNVIIKLMAVMNVFTLRHYYANVVLFNFLFFFGPVALYRVAIKKFTANKFFLIAAVFCIPSFLFWCSGAHKDGFIVFQPLG